MEKNNTIKIARIFKNNKISKMFDKVSKYDWNVLLNKTDLNEA